MRHLLLEEPWNIRGVSLSGRGAKALHNRPYVVVGVEVRQPLLLSGRGCTCGLLLQGGF